MIRDWRTVTQCISFTGSMLGPCCSFLDAPFVNYKSRGVQFKFSWYEFNIRWELMSPLEICDFHVRKNWFSHKRVTNVVRLHHNNVLASTDPISSLWQIFTGTSSIGIHSMSSVLLPPRAHPLWSRIYDTWYPVQRLSFSVYSRLYVPGSVKSGNNQRKSYSLQWCWAVSNCLFQLPLFSCDNRSRYKRR